MKKRTFIIGFIGVLLLIQPISAQTWEATKRLTWNSGPSENPIIRTDSKDNIHLVWYDGTPGNYEIFYKRSTNGGANWTTTRLTWNPSYSKYPAVAIDASNHIHTTWNDTLPGNNEIYHKKSINGGGTWIDAERLTWNPGISVTSEIAADSSNRIHLVWSDDTPGNYEIYYRKGIQ